MCEENITLLQDSVYLVKREIDSVYNEKLILLETKSKLENDISKLKQDNNQMANTIKDFQILKEKNFDIIVQDTIKEDKIIHLVQGIDTTFKVNWSDELINSELSIKIKGCELSCNEFNYGIRIPIEIFLTKDLNVILKSSNQKVMFSNVTTLVDPIAIKNAKKKHHAIGLQLGMGIVPGYDFLGKKFAITAGPCISIGYTFTFYQW